MVHLTINKIYHLEYVFMASVQLCKLGFSTCEQKVASLSAVFGRVAAFPLGSWDT